MDGFLLAHRVAVPLFQLAENDGGEKRHGAQQEKSVVVTEGISLNKPPQEHSYHRCSKRLERTIYAKNSSIKVKVLPQLTQLLSAVSLGFQPLHLQSSLGKHRRNLWIRHEQLPN